MAIKYFNVVINILTTVKRTRFVKKKKGVANHDTLLVCFDVQLKSSVVVIAAIAHARLCIGPSIGKTALSADTFGPEQLTSRCAD